MKVVIDIDENWETEISNMSDAEIVDFLYTVCREGTIITDDEVEQYE